MGTFLRRLLQSVNVLYLIEAVDRWRQTPVKTKDLPGHQGGQRQVIKRVRQHTPHMCVSILAQTLIIKPVDLCDLSALMVASQDGDACWVSHFQGQQEENDFHGVVSSVDIVTHEQVIGVGQVTANAK